jgi:hypothetical protein
MHLIGLDGIDCQTYSRPPGPAAGVAGLLGFKFAHACFFPVFSGELKSIIFHIDYLDGQVGEYASGGN